MVDGYACIFIDFDSSLRRQHPPCVHSGWRLGAASTLPSQPILGCVWLGPERKQQIWTQRFYRTRLFLDAIAEIVDAGGTRATPTAPKTCATMASVVMWRQQGENGGAAWRQQGDNGGAVWQRCPKVQAVSARQNYTGRSSSLRELGAIIRNPIKILWRFF